MNYQNELLRDTVTLLNDLLARDRGFIENLVKVRIPCNESVASHPSVQVRGTGGESFEAGLLGVMNGLLGSIPEKLCALYDEDDKLVEFQVLEKDNG